MSWMAFANSMNQPSKSEAGSQLWLVGLYMQLFWLEAHVQMHCNQS